MKGKTILLGIFVLLLASVVNAVDCGMQDCTDVQGLWHFDGDTLDYSGNNYHGIDGGYYTYKYVDGISGNAINLEKATHQFEFPGTGTLGKNSSQISVSAWVHQKQLQTNFSQIIAPQTINFTAPSLWGKRFGLGISGTSEGSKFVFEIFTNTGIFILNSSVSAIPNTWQHVVGVYDSTTSTQKIYVDSVLDQQSATGNLFTSNNSDSTWIYLGVYPGGGWSLRLNGSIDEVMILNRSISQAEVLQINHTVRCNPNWTVNHNSCQIDDTKLKFYTDANSCGKSLYLPSDNGTYIYCDYCLPDIQLTPPTNWTNQTACRIDDTYAQNRSWIKYDQNKSVCYDITNLSTDYSPNATMWGYQNQTCDYCLPIWNASTYNTTGHCDGVVDLNSCFSATNLPSDVYMGNYSEFPIFESVVGNLTNATVEINNQTTYMNSTAKVTIKKSGRTIAEFDFDFSNGNVLDLSNITTTQGASAGKIYLLVNGVQQSGTKTFYLNNASANYNWICVKDTIVNDVGEISSNCQGTNEHHLQCNGAISNGYVCTNNNQTLTITGLQHSGVIQSDDPVVIPPPVYSGGGGGGGGSYYIPPKTNETIMTIDNCSTEWNCSEWRECNDVTQTQSRTCNNKCGEIISDMRACDKKLEEGATPQPSDSGTHETQTNQITGAVVGTEEAEKFNWKGLGAVALLVLGVAVIGTLIYFKRRH